MYRHLVDTNSVESYAKHLLDKPVAERPRSVTPLYAWLRARNMPVKDFAEALGFSHADVYAWSVDKVQPSLVQAFRIEKFTGGGVPAMSWLATPLGKALWSDSRVRRN